MTLEALADAVGLSYSQISRFESGDREPRVSEIERIAGVFGVTAAVMIGEVVPTPLVSWVSAGDPKVADAVLETDDTPKVYAPGLDPRGDWIALRVEGTSMDRISPPDSIILVNRRDKRLVPNACYVISLDEEGEATYKRYRPDPERFEPVSTQDHETLYFPQSSAPRIIGRVRRTILDL